MKRKDILHYAIEFAMVFSGVLLAFYFSQLSQEKSYRADSRALLELLSAECADLPDFLFERIARFDSIDLRLRNFIEADTEVNVDSLSSMIADFVIPNRVRVRNEETIILIKPQIDRRFIDDIELREALENYYTYSLASDRVSDEEQAFINSELRPYFEANCQYFGHRIINREYHRTLEFRNYMFHLLRYNAMRKAIYEELRARGEGLDSVVTNRLQHF